MGMDAFEHVSRLDLKRGEVANGRLLDVRDHHGKIVQR